MAITLALVAPTQGGAGMLPLIINFGAIIAIFYFLLIRPQRQAAKRHQEMIANLKRGDMVVTEGGIIGEIVHLRENEVTLKTGDTRIVVLRSKVARLLTGEAVNVGAEKR